MARRFAATSALVLAALALSPAARAEGFFSFYEMSPRDVLSRLDEQGYSPRIPMTRRGDVYIVDARTAAGRSVRLIVSTHDGAILERYAVAPRYEEWDRPRVRDDEDAYRPERRPQAALGDTVRPRVLNFDGSGQDRLVPPASVPDGGAAERSRRHALRKPTAPPAAKDAPEPAVAAVAPPDSKSVAPRVLEVPQAKVTPAKPDVKAPPTPEPTTQAKIEAPKPETPRIIEISPPKTAVAPAKPEFKAAPTPEPTAQARIEAPKPEAPRIVREPNPPVQAKVEDKPAPKVDAPKAEAPKPAPAQAKADDKPKAETPRKKLNDLPVGTLD